MTWYTLCMFKWFSGENGGSIVYHAVDIGGSTVQIPVAHLTGSSEGPHILIIGGMDGDEYAGMEACYRLIEKYTHEPFAGEITIVPILNVPGFRAEMSMNPLDSQYPKYMFPGSRDGSPTKRMLYWLSNTYAGRVSFWIELHGGALTESMTHIAWSSTTGVTEVDTRTQKVLDAMSDMIIVRDKAGSSSRDVQLAKKGTSFLLFEAGARGSCSENEVSLLIQWVELVMKVSGNVVGTAPSAGSQNTIVKEISYVYAPSDGFAHIQPCGPRIERTQPIATIFSLDRRKIERIAAPTSGVVLWRKETPAIRKNDILCAIGVVE